MKISINAGFGRNQSLGWAEIVNGTVIAGEFPTEAHRDAADLVAIGVDLSATMHIMQEHYGRDFGCELSDLDRPELLAPTTETLGQEIERIFHLATLIYQSDLDWEKKYDLIFSETISKKVFALVRLDYCDPDSTYEADTHAFMAALGRKLDELRERALSA